MPFTPEGAEKCLTTGLTSDPIFLSLHSTPDEASEDNEISGNGYGRLRIEPTEWTVDGIRATLNAELDWPTVTGDQGQPNWVAGWSAADGGTMYFCESISVVIDPIQIGNRVFLAIGDIVLKLPVI